MLQISGYSKFDLENEDKFLHFQKSSHAPSRLQDLNFDHERKTGEWLSKPELYQVINFLNFV